MRPGPESQALYRADGYRVAVAVIAKIGLLERRGKVRTPSGVFEVVREEDSGFTVGGPAAEGPGRVHYDDDRDVLDIQRPGISVSIVFRPELEHTTFDFRGHVYEVGTMDFGDISIREGGRSVVKGHVTISGVRLQSVEPELLPIERELAFGLALRSSSLDEDSWREDQPFLTGLEESAEDAVLREDERLHHEGP